MSYVLDTSFFITAWRIWYRPAVFPSLWTRLDELIEDGTVCSSEEVRRELEAKDDELHAWAKSRPALFLPTNGTCWDASRAIVKEYPELLKNKPTRNGADPFVIATARLHSLKVVTNENLSSSAKNPHIPDICEGLGIGWLDIPGFIQEIGWTF